MVDLLLIVKKKFDTIILKLYQTNSINKETDYLLAKKSKQHLRSFSRTRMIKPNSSNRYFMSIITETKVQSVKKQFSVGNNLGFP
ncbi:hypothetical protein IKE_05921 [Bacillus cereus VD196]|uniref:Uncharacterized protein n=1 Tax=Bacillus cereus VD196 TaxID=1053243 RepID=A0A9W5V5Y7_BACCE|nr:hypothetical protein IKG_05570 [Bacillus cereus VD200]EOO61314.1 hypothetical protein IKE_05921 [Bacillus cereus VD196]